jgi:glutaredoxin
VAITVPRPAERKVFAERGIRYHEVDVDRDPDALEFMTKVLGVPAVPATVFGTRLLPGYNAEEFGQIVGKL